MHRKEIGHILSIAGVVDPITTGAKLLDITYDSYGFSADLLQTIN